MLRLYDELKEEIRKATHSEFSILLLEALFEKPTFTKPMMIEMPQKKSPECSSATLRKIVTRIVDEDFRRDLEALSCIDDWVNIRSIKPAPPPRATGAFAAPSPQCVPRPPCCWFNCRYRYKPPYTQ